MGIEKQGLYLPEFEHENCGAGFICSLKGIKSNDIIHKALEILEKLEHRGAVSSDGKTGDGAGILIDIPHDFFQQECHFELPEAGRYAAGNVFLPKSENQRNYCIQIFEKNCNLAGLKVHGWRRVPVDHEVPGTIASRSEPNVWQVFISPEGEEKDQLVFERNLFVARKKTENEIRTSKLSQSSFFYIPSITGIYRIPV